MDAPQSGVLKKNQVRMTGSRPVAPTRPAAVAPQTGEGGASARVVSQNAAGAVIEVTCPCGQVIQVLCEFPGG